jgi:hypothetical protein
VLTHKPVVYHGLALALLYGFCLILSSVVMNQLEEATAEALFEDILGGSGVLRVDYVRHTDDELRIFLPSGHDPHPAFSCSEGSLP